MVLRKGSFGLGTNSDSFLRKRNHLLRTISAQPAPTSPTGAAAHARPERTQSQSDTGGAGRERPERGHGGQAAQRSMSMAASCFGRSGSTKREPGAFNLK